MLNIKNAKKLNRNQTIDLKYIISKEYCDKVENKNLIIEKIKKYLGIAGIMWFVLIFSFGWGIITPPEVKASSKEQKVDINEEYSYYGVNNYKNYARKIRIETCYRTGIEILGEVTKNQIIHCATINTLITAYESNFMKSNMCSKDFNCKGLKGFQNGIYGFMKFKNHYEENLYFGKKFWTYHYKKSLFTFIYGFKQIDGNYKWGWSSTQQNTYLKFLNSKYNIIYNELINLYY